MTTMTEQRIALEQAAIIFEHARDLDGEAREAYLDEACSGDAPLRAEIQSMIEAHGEQGEFLSEPTQYEAVRSRTGTFDTQQLAERVGTKIGRYKLLQRIGEGGFGVVYMAEQQEPDAAPSPRPIVSGGGSGRLLYPPTVKFTADVWV